MPQLIKVLLAARTEEHRGEPDPVMTAGIALAHAWRWMSDAAPRTPEEDAAFAVLRDGIIRRQNMGNDGMWLLEECS